MDVSPKKRLRQDDDEHALASNKRSRLWTSNAGALLLQQQVATLQAELDHVRAARALDQKAASQTKTRLEQQLSLAVEEASSSNALLQQWRATSEEQAQNLRQARDAALQQVSELTFQLQESQADAEQNQAELEQAEQDLAKARHQVHQQQPTTEQELAWNEQLEQIKVDCEKQYQARLDEWQKQQTPSLLEDAPPAVLKELNRVRLQLAETERRERQLERQVKADQRRNKTLIQEREQAIQDSKRLQSVEASLQQLQSEHERLKAENETWLDFGRRLSGQLRALNIQVAPDGPPELSTILRFFETSQKQTLLADRNCQEALDKCKSLQATIDSQETKLKECNEKERKWLVKQEDWKQKLDTAQSQVEVLQGQDAIYKREADGLRSLIKTFDELPLAPKGGAAAESPGMDTTAKTLELSLSSTRQELDLMKNDRDRLSQELEVSRKADQEQRNELERVREKFFKLRDTLQAERAKVESAEARANEAEALAGKGSFDPERTRVLHWKETPLTQALKEEIQVLKRQIEATKGEKPSKLAPDPDKLNERLKSKFKEQIALFREGVYLMTGYKVDMLPGSDRPTFRVRSMYAEKEEDHFLFKWPKGEEITSLDLLNTDLAKVLATTPSYSYMTKFHSLPAFLSSVQLSLFEKQTVAM